MNIELIQGTLEVSESPGMETTDPRFSDIATLVQEGNYEEAATLAEAILAEKIYDIRIIGYFFYGHFIEGGVAALAEISLSLADLLSENLEALGPVRNRGKHLQTSLNWLTKQIFRTLQYEEEKKSDLYEEWVSGVSSDQVQEALDAGDSLRRILGPVLEDAATPILEGLTKITDWLKAFQRLVYRESEAEPAEETGFEVEEETAAQDRMEQELRRKEKRRFHPSGPEAGEETAGLEGSYHLKMLIKKLEAFDDLIAEKKFSSAAIVADDINAIIANFDPRIYFPKLFLNFALNSAGHINDLAAFAEYRETVAWQAMQELYKVDLESFVRFNPEPPDMGVSSASGEYGGMTGYDQDSEDDY
ncbi:hypothetical protein SAMN04489760_10427 [Syntrophus gentianae]|uniref:ImpA N-terminal domain-containing protein n=1 Tax=Syntrophus gentianae TaxID=43775 RepID=A0A1H7VK24_9BACT|nr:type VI secretion system protein IglI family protein [Syntrophus gentianae]SEM09530.1 hypothetical protein SAMN04489760_10427 [Syntrophus gentianae]